MRSLFTLLAACSMLALQAQQQVRITRWDAIRTGNDLIKGRSVKAALQATGLPEDQQALVVANSGPQFWPVALSNDSARHASAPYIGNYAGAHGLQRHRRSPGDRPDVA